MTKLSLPAIACSLLAAQTFADDPAAREVTFTRDVLPIVQQNCVICHRPGGQNIAGMVAPFSLTTYEEARPWAKSIEEAVSSKTMPPWYASDHTKGVFKNERGLTDEQIATLVAWVRTGAKRGNPSDAPAPVHFEDTGGWIIGKPDLEVKIPEPYLVKDDVEDEYKTFTVEIPADQLPEDRWLRALEWKPGAECVHHIVGFELYKDENGKQGRQGLGSVAPGEEPPIFPAGYGKRLHKGARIAFQMHYHKEPGPGTQQIDRSSVGFRFWDEEKDPPVQHAMIWAGIVNFRFALAPNNPNIELKADRTFDVDTTVLSLHPHMHLRGKSAEYIAYYPDGSQEVLLTVPNWNFDWQLDYTFREPKRVPAGTRIEYTAVFDNSSENPANPDPNRTVTWGEATTDEMMIGFIHYTDSAPHGTD
jgi:mono/diheme cytochrome c family protein